MNSKRGFVEVPDDCEKLSDCYCWQCMDFRIMSGEFDEQLGLISDEDRMFATATKLPLTAGFGCQKCGNKRCPHCEWHGYKCTHSNALDQEPELA